MDRQEEHVNIAHTTKEFYTEVWHFTIIYAQVTAADVALIMIPCDCHFTTAIAKGNRKAGDMQGQTRQHSRCINLLCVKQIAIGCNKLDCDTAGYKITRYEDVSKEHFGQGRWKKEVVEGKVPFLPISGWIEDTQYKIARV